MTPVEQIALGMGLAALVGILLALEAMRWSDLRQRRRLCAAQGHVWRIGDDMNLFCARCLKIQPITNVRRG